MKRNRYIVFAGDFYYPDGGVNDIVGSVPELEMVQGMLNEDVDWVNVLDLVTGESIYPEDIVGCEDYEFGGYDVV